MTEEAPLTTTLKLPGAAAPWIVVRSNNAVQLQQQLAELEAGTVFADIGRVQTAFEAQFNVGHIMGGRGVAPAQDTGAFAPQAPAPQPVEAPQPAYQQAPAQQYQQAPQPPQQAYQPPAQVPGAPMICGMPAKLVEGAKNGRKWQAWADPRPREVTDGLAKTDDPNDPRLLAGQASFWKFVR